MVPRVLTAAAALALLPACASTRLERSLHPPETASTLDGRSPFLKVHTKTGELYVFNPWHLDEAARTVSGEGERFGLDRQALDRGAFSVPLESVALLETNVVQRSPALGALAVVTGVSVAVTAYCIANPKACFGSCPTFYVDDGRGPSLQAEGFSASVAPSLEARDVDALFRARPAGRRVRVTMRNEALETHVVKLVRLLAARRPPGGRVLATLDGRFREAAGLRPVEACHAEEGDCRARVEAFDGEERWSPADGTDLARRETIELRIAPDDGPRALVIASRQALASTYLFYQTLAWLGRTAGDSLAALERGDRGVRAGLERIRAAIGGIEVLAEDPSGAWVPAGEVREMGPLATDVVAVPLPEGSTGRIRLRLARGHWRLDFLASARLGAAVEPLLLEPEAVHGVPAPPVSGPLVTLPGDAYVYDFRLPGEASRYELFLESRGYYLEWMREEWRAEEDPGRAARLALAPEQALVELAPAFKKQEALMESQFWRSRYARP